MPATIRSELSRSSASSILIVLSTITTTIPLLSPPHPRLTMSLSSLLSKATDMLFPFAQCGYFHLRDLESEIVKLQEIHDSILDVLTAAEQHCDIKQNSFKRQILVLKDIFFIADELLDRRKTQLELSSLYQSSDKAGPSYKRKRSLSLPSLGLGHVPVLLQRWSLATEIAKINKRFEETIALWTNLGLGFGDGRNRMTESSPRSQSVATYESFRTVGREIEKAKIVEASTSSDCDGAVHVLLIYGAPGIGKTTLARLVYTSAQVEDYFDARIWAGLLEGFDGRRVIKDLIKAVETRNVCGLLRIDPQCHLKNMVCARNFLLVLDNLQADDFPFWDMLRLSLIDAGIESKVLITTRSQEVWRGMNTPPPIHLEGLKVDACSELLLKQAFPHGCSSRHPNLEQISRRIVERCQGSPLAAKLLGYLLRNVTEEDKWEDMLKEVCSLEEDTNGILPSLMISYNHLNFHLKQCFKYCSLFPIGYEFDRDELIRLWIAEGLIQRNGSRSTLEVIGSKYFDNLLWRSFFQVSCSRGQKQRYSMPSLVHDLARLVSEPESLVVEHGVSCDKPEWVRYATLFHQNDEEAVPFDKVYGYKNLRTFKLLGEPRERVKQVPGELFLKLRCLRVLDLSCSDIEELPDSVGDLIHLRYLGLYRTGIQKLPESVCWLYNLQTLDLGECYRLQELPKGTGFMVNLRHLDLHVDWERDADSMMSMPQRIGRLTSLQTLSRFIVTSENECNIGELKDLSLRGELCISKLENVVAVTDAQKANLNRKQIEKLKLQWSATINPTGPLVGSACEMVIACLHPHSRLKNLWIENYPGSNFPDWVGDSSFSLLETLRLSWCKNCEQLPLIAKLPRLRNLWIQGMRLVRSMGNFAQFQSLEKLTLSDMPKLERFVEVEGVEIPMLRELSILRCPEMEELNALLPMLVKLELRNSQKLTLLPEFPSLRDLIIERGNESMIRWIGHLTSLTSLTLSHFSGCISSSSLALLTSLKELKIKGRDCETSFL